MDASHTTSRRRRSSRGTGRSSWSAIELAVALALAASILAVVWLAGRILLLIFAGTLFGLLLGTPVTWIVRRFAIDRTIALLMVVVVALLLTATLGAALFPEVSRQTDELARRLPESIDSAESYLNERAWGRWLVSEASRGGRQVLANAVGFLFSAVGVLTSAFVIGFVGIYVAVSPHVYVSGLLHLVPEAERREARRLLHSIASTLRFWIVARLCSMSLIGVLTTAAFWLLGLDLALALGLVIGLSAFIPYAGAIVGFVPALLLALVQSTDLALWVLALYLAIQMVESYLLTPLIEKKAVSLPPALAIAAQAVLGTLAGPLGIALASPLTAVVLTVLDRSDGAARYAAGARRRASARIRSR